MDFLKKYCLHIVFAIGIMPVGSCQQIAVRNKYLIDSIQFRLVDLLPSDGNDCRTILNYDSARANLYCGIGMRISKAYYSDSNSQKGYFTSGIEKGLDGTSVEIEKFQLGFEKDSILIPLTSEFKGMATLEGVDKNSLNYSVKKVTAQGCGSTEYFASIEDFITSVNNNSKRTTGQNLDTEIFFFITKEKFNSYIHNSDRFIINFQLTNGISFRYEYLLDTNDP